jgi:hypothetical protein
VKVPGFLIDENLPPVIAVQLRQREPQVQALAIGQPGAPSRGTPDPQLLYWLEENDYLLITNNRASMPGHLHDHLATGRHVPGILVTPFPLNIGAVIEELLLIWGASLPNEYQDRIIYLPVSR